MAYITIASLESIFGRQMLREAAHQPGDDLHATRMPEARLQAAIDAAEEEADGYLGRRYALPLASVPLTLKRHVSALAFANLFQGGGREVPERVSIERASAMRWLKDVASGAFVLGGAAPPPTTGTDTPVVLASSTRPLSPDALAGY